VNSRIVRTILGIKTGRQLALAMKFELSMFLPCRVPHNVSARDTVLGSAYSNLECYLMRLRITLNRSIRQQEDILLTPASHICTQINRMANDDEACSATVELAQNQNRLFQ
jgi:hypothetical protein